jgi:hypothetical protein
MKIRFILPFLIILFLFIAPVSGSLNKIVSNAPVFVGETDVDISSALNGCHNIAWWPQGADITRDPAAANLTISEIDTASQRNFHFNFSPDIFSGHTGTWYCQDKKPYFSVFDVQQPENNISILNLDTNEDITGQSVFFTTKLAYRIDTNMYPELKYANRPNYNPIDSFFTVTITDPLGRSVPYFIPEVQVTRTLRPFRWMSIRSFRARPTLHSACRHGTKPPRMSKAILGIPRGPAR